MAASPSQFEYVESTMSRAHGVVLELGPGQGDQNVHYKVGKIDKLYAVEPNRHFHPTLLQKAKETGLEGKYFPIAAAAQPNSLLPALRAAGLLPSDVSVLPGEGVFDSIVAIKSMCSVSSDELPETLIILQGLLKPGGQFLFFEHLQNDTSLFTQSFVWLLNLFAWPALMGGCRLDGKLDKVVLEMVGWESREMENVREYQGHEVCRYTKGVCTNA
jgi:hypothetical protein